MGALDETTNEESVCTSSAPIPQDQVLKLLREGAVIPAHPLALTRECKLNERRQRALTRYYMAAGAGGVAIGVHTTQFAIHNPKTGLLRPVLEIGAEALDDEEARSERQPVRIAGICGPTRQAVREAELARDLGYHAGLLSFSALSAASVDDLIVHARAVAEAIPLFGFYLQTSVGGRVLSLEFWRRFVQIENVVAVKIAPFNRYQTLDVLRAVAESGRSQEIALYTGNDDNIIADLLSTFQFFRHGMRTRTRIVGGLLGHWAVWTRNAVSQLRECHRLMNEGGCVPCDMLTLATQVTDANAAFFDAEHNFAGCIPGIHEVLRRQGLFEGTWCLDPDETLSPGQLAEIDRVYSAYPNLNDDAFVAENLDDWLR